MKKAIKILKFPKNFLWGTSTSAHQIEGGITNDWSQWEKSAKRVKEFTEQGKNPEDFISGQACDSYNRYEEDFDLAKKLNTGAIRFGIEWARIEPQTGNWDMSEIEHYKEVIAAAKKCGLKVVLTLWHWTNPTWIAYIGGWSNKKTVDYYKRYVKLVVSELGREVDYWVTLNEPMVHVFDGYVTGKFPPNKHNIFKARRVFNNLVKAHKKAYNIIHELQPKAQVSITKLVNYFEPARKWCPDEILIAKWLHYLWNYKFLSKIKKQLDYIGVDYYFHDRIVWYPPFKKNLNRQVTDMGWEIYPEGIYYVLKYLGKFKKPIFVMENGLADANDEKREKFIVEHLYYVHQAIKEGIKVRGYFYWSLLDNFEWAHGWEPKFGLCDVDRNSFKRTIRLSAKKYAEICQNNSLRITN